MTATYRHHVGLALNAVLLDAAANAGRESPLGGLGTKVVNVWQGAMAPRQHRRCLAFSVKLPRDIGEAVYLFDLLELAPEFRQFPGISRQRDTLLRKLAAGLGLPMYRYAVSNPQERAFLDACGDAPQELANWTAYADWLQEQPDPAVVLRGQVMAGWLGPKAVKVKYGLPVIINGRAPL